MVHNENIISHVRLAADFSEVSFTPITGLPTITGNDVQLQH